jgi:hypothetical protein
LQFVQHRNDLVRLMIACGKNKSYPARPLHQRQNLALPIFPDDGIALPVGSS